MAAVTSMLTLFLSLSLAFGAEPGGKLAVTDKGLDYLNQLAENLLRNKLQTVSIPDQSGSEGKKSWSLRNIHINGISGPNTHISLNPGANGITLAISNFGINMHADWNAKYRIIFKISSSGSVDLSVSGASVTVVAGLGEKNGRPSVTAQSCSCRIDDIGIKFHGGLAAVILNLFRGVIRNKIRNILQDKVCELVNTQVNTRADEELAKMKVSVEIARRFILDYSLTKAPTVTDNYIEVATKGAVYWKDNRQESPFTAAALPALNEFNNMLYLYITEYSANTFLYVAHVNGFLTYNITVDKLPIDSSELLNPTGQLKEHYPESKLELRINSASAPSVTFNNQKLTTSAVANVGVVIHSQNGEVSPLELRVSVSVTIQPSVLDGRLTASIADYTFNIAVIKSDIGEINEQEFNTLIREAIDSVVIPGLNGMGKQGIDLPVTGIFRLYNTQLNLQTGYMQVATDVEYLP